VQVSTNDGSASDRFNSEKTRIEEFAKSCIVRIEQVEAEMGNNCEKWGAEQENIVVNECLRIFGIDCLTKCKSLPAIPHKDSEEEVEVEVEAEVEEVVVDDAEEEEEEEEEKEIENVPPPTQTHKTHSDFVSLEEAVGRQVSVYWSDVETWYDGKVDQFVSHHPDNIDNGWHVTYEDGDEEWIDPETTRATFPLTEEERKPIEIKIKKKKKTPPIQKEKKQSLWQKNRSSLITKKVTAGSVDELSKMSSLFGGAIDEQLLNSWRCKCTIELMKHRMTNMPKEILRQANCSLSISNKLNDSAEKSLGEERGLIVDWIKQRNVKARAKNADMMEKERMRVESRKVMEMRGWELFSEIVAGFASMSHRHGKQLLDNWKSYFASVVDDGDDTNNDGDEGEMMQKHMNKLLEILENDGKVGEGIVRDDKKSLESMGGGYVNGIVGAVNAFGEEARSEEKTYEELKESEGEKVVKIVNTNVGKLENLKKIATKAGTKDVENAIRKAEAAVKNLNFYTCGPENIDILDKLWKEIDVKATTNEIHPNAADAESLMGKSREELQNLKKETETLLESAFTKLEEAMAAKKMCVLVKINRVEDAGRGELATKVQENVKKDKARVREVEAHMNEKIEVLMKEFDDDMNLLKQSQVDVVDKGKEEKAAFLKKEILVLESFVTVEMKGKCGEFPGNSNVEEQCKCIDRTFSDRKVNLNGLLVEVVEVEEGEVKREEAELVVVRTKHNVDMKKAWHKHTEAYVDWRETVDGEGGEMELLVKKIEGGMKSEGEMRLQKELGIRESWTKDEKGGWLGGVVNVLKEAEEKEMGLLEEMRGLEVELRKLISETGVEKLIEETKARIGDEIKSREDKLEREKLNAEEEEGGEEEEEEEGAGEGANFGASG